MKKNLLTIILIPIISFSQGKEDLYYFKSKDSLVGVKDKAGKIIVPAQFKIFSFLKDGDPVEGETILFDGSREGEKPEKNAWGYVYDRKGKFLYQPFLYDNSADYFSEGLRRLVKNGKVGFADRNGKTIIEAEHDFASPFNYGYAAFCDGCDWEKTNDEHRAIVGGKWSVMNTKGQTVQPVAKPSGNEVEIDGKYYPNPFQYNEKEKNILHFFEKQEKKLSDLYYVNFYNKLSENEKNLFFEIVERPKENFPYYQVNTYDYRKKELDMLYRFKFMVSEDGKSFYAIEDYNEKKVPFENWLKEEIKNAEDFQKEHKDNPNKFINK
ncbi:WG repeat-containing protein (plasmid) [Chryseobacterium panacisoli]|uniref:WG repeat-containing protein n=1 Tax=Chryseobacterium panacisoli TaxID=1807141 RepID=A0A5D8ZX45_9FLAO|nr:WG repeat-containing protein [Chryseobacterium panacisoli]TZF99100.1 WG repeat-containing protein [Chryseobacterium panacisoli]